MNHNESESIRINQNKLESFILNWITSEQTNKFEELRINWNNSKHIHKSE